MKSFVQDNEVITEPRRWDVSWFAKKLEEYGYSVSLPVEEPLTMITFGLYKMMPVEEIKPSIDSAREKYTTPTVEILSDNSLWFIGGDNSTGRGMAQRVTQDAYSFQQINSDTDWDNIAASLDYSIASKTDGSIWSWGTNTQGTLGLDDITVKSVPTMIEGFYGKFDDIIAKANTVFGLKL